MIEVDVAKIRKAWNPRSGHLVFLIQADYSNPGEPTYDDLVEIAGGVTHGLARERATELGKTPYVDQWLRTPKGWTGVLWRAHTMDDILEWFDLFAATWRDQVEGRVIAPGTSGPRPLPDRLRQQSVPCAFVAYTTGDLNQIPRNDRSPVWYVDPSITRYVMDQTITWAYQRDSRQYLNREDVDWWTEVTGLDHATTAAQAIDHYVGTTLTTTTTEPRGSRGADFLPQGLATFHAVQDGLDRAGMLDAVRAILTWTPPHTDLAYIATDQFRYSSWDPEFLATPWPYVTEPEVRYNRPLLASFTPDAYGIQLLTDAHLDRATNLDNWTITPLAGGRHLVEAPDLDPWYATEHPHPDVLTQARHDFGPMILTSETIKTHNPWRG